MAGPGLGPGTGTGAGLGPVAGPAWAPGGSGHPIVAVKEETVALGAGGASRGRGAEGGRGGGRGDGSSAAPILIDLDEFIASQVSDCLGAGR